ncbi:dihydrofolate reductase family protein [Pedobacter sp. MC2016-05]|uniref:dihydrofolate reductase family protein n=1 Tax=Pedobacter sp. MC2016-05 TaxID=2994474 RepID=UPI002246EE04|nr:dihydrofolate reductase family protein [Pedobacter sp. MC2016-05]MCX2473902.1 dihydrofolate reductase family protein [Pedobacter sp. MC2016-05]
MRKIIVLSMISLDGVMQAPGGPNEDNAGGFKHGGWVAPFNDEISGTEMQKNMEASDILLGRKTFDIFAGYWPEREQGWPGINDVNKYVLSSTLKQSTWKNTTFLTNLEDIKQLKNTNSGDIKIWGSSKLVQLLLAHNLVDEFIMMVHPVILGKGKRLFNDEAIAASFQLIESVTSKKGVIFAKYKRFGEVKTGTVSD